MSTLTSSPVSTIERVATGNLWRAALLGGVLAAVANIVVLLIANALGLTLDVPLGPNATETAPMGVLPVILASFLPALGAAGLLALLARFTRRPITIFLGVSALFLLLSFGPLLGTPVVVSTKVVLGLMHLVAAVPIVWALVTQGREA